jgi:hypothetical protein
MNLCSAGWIWDNGRDGGRLMKPPPPRRRRRYSIRFRVAEAEDLPISAAYRRFSGSRRGQADAFAAVARCCGDFVAGSMADTIQPRADAAPQRFPLTGGQVVAAIYRIVFRGPGGKDVFANAAVGWTNFIAPVVVFSSCT